MNRLVICFAMILALASPVEAAWYLIDQSAADGIRQMVNAKGKPSQAGNWVEGPSGKLRPQTGRWTVFYDEATGTIQLKGQATLEAETTAAMAAHQRRQAAAEAAKLENQLAGMSPEDAALWVENNVTDLASAKAVLARLAYLVQALRINKGLAPPPEK